MAGAWSMNVGGRVYGPFSSERMRSLASEGRLAADSLVATEGASEWRAAGQEPEFSDLFTAEGKEVARAAPKPAPAPAPKSEAVPSSADAAERKATQFTIVIDIKSRSSGGLERAILSLGDAYRLVPNVWILSTDQTANAVRNRLVQEIGKADTLFVVDASRGKAAWFNFGPEADAHIRRVWHKAS